MRRRVPVVAIAAFTGGVAWLVAVSLVGARSEGSPGEHRSVADVLPWLLGGWVLIAFATDRLVVGRAIGSGRTGRWVRALSVWGVTVSAVGALAIGFGASSVAIAIFAVGYLSFAIAMVLLGIGLVRTGVVPSGAAWALVIGGGLLALFTTDDLRVFLGLPFAVAWILIGFSLGRMPPSRR